MSTSVSLAEEGRRIRNGILCGLRRLINIYQTQPSVSTAKAKSIQGGQEIDKGRLKKKHKKARSPEGVCSR